MVSDEDILFVLKSRSISKDFFPVIREILDTKFCWKCCHDFDESVSTFNILMHLLQEDRNDMIEAKRILRKNNIHAASDRVDGLPKFGPTPPSSRSRKYVKVSRDRKPSTHGRTKVSE